jgi:threonine dehydratase
MGAVVFVPEGASRSKLALLDELGAEVRVAGRDLDEAKEEARRAAAGDDVRFFEDGAERAQYDGYRAIGRELLDQVEEPPRAVVVPVGNGALLGGVGLEVCRRIPERIGVAAKEAPVMAESWAAGEPVESDRCATIADGLAVRVAIPLAVRVIGEVATRMLVVSERAIARALIAFADAGIRVEPAAAAGLAALEQLDDVGGPVVLVVTGRNIDEELLTRARERPESFPD